jgi:hypothetical protein
MHLDEDLVQDVMQVCRNGHVITDLLRSFPERSLVHCDRCGADTIERCPTCGRDLAGAIVVPGMQPVGVRQPPAFCTECGAAFPWTVRSRTVMREPLVQLLEMLRRLPRVVRQLRSRQGEQPPFAIADEKDLEDLFRSLLPLHFDDIRPQCRTPHYATGTRMDFLLAPEKIVVTSKFVRAELRESQFVEQVQEDAAYYRAAGNCRTLVVYYHDPEGLVRDPVALALACARREDELEVRCVVGAFG